MGFETPEEDLIRRTGLPRRLVRENRGAPGVWWVRSANGRLMWSAEGESALLKKLGGTPPSNSTTPSEAPGEGEESPAPQKNEAPPLLEIETLTVARVVGIRNTRVLQAIRDVDPGELLTVVVQDHKNFRPGMKLLARQREGTPNTFDFLGNPEKPEQGRRLPRRPGMW